jgi:hypothetical protein
MLEILKFIFSSFWIWLGTLILITSSGISIGVAVNSIILGTKGVSVK